MALARACGIMHCFKRCMSTVERGVAGKQLPAAYKKFWREWRLLKPTRVYIIPKTREWHRDELTGEITQYPAMQYSYNDSTVYGWEPYRRHQRRSLRSRTKRRTVLYSCILNEYHSLGLTDFVAAQIHEAHGLDHYILKTLACDLPSTFALKLKRKMLLELARGCTSHNDNKREQARVLQEYQCYLQPFTKEEIEWYGLTLPEAVQKLQEKPSTHKTLPVQRKTFFMSLMEKILWMSGSGSPEEIPKPDAQNVIVKQNEENTKLVKVKPRNKVFADLLKWFSGRKYLW